MLSFLLAIINFGQTMAQEYDTNENVAVSFLRDTLKLRNGQLAFNNVVLTNLSSNTLSLGTRIELPKGWSLFSNIPSGVDIMPGQSITLPFRIKAAYDAYGNRKYILRFYIDDPSSGKTITKYIYAIIEANTTWSAELLNPNSFALETQALPDFKFKIQNNGNKTEAFDINFQSELRLSYPSTGLQLFLKPGQDTIINVGIRSRFLNQVSDKILIEINSRNTIKILKQNIYFLSNVYQPREIKYNYAPINITWNSSNLLNPSNTYYYIQADSYIKLEKNNAISFRIKSNGQPTSDNVYGNFALFNLHLNKLTISAGNQQDYMYNPIIGNGIKLEYRTDGTHQEIYGLKGQLFNATTLGLRQESFLKNGLNFKTEVQYNKNNTNNLKNLFGIYQIGLSELKNLEFNLKAGFCNESLSNLSLNKYGYILGYTFSLNKSFFRIKSNYQSYSGYMPGTYRGSLNQFHNAEIRLKYLAIGGIYTETSRQPVRYLSNYSETTNYLSIQNKEYGLSTRLFIAKNSVSLKLTKFSFFQNTKEGSVMSGDKISFSHSIRNSKFEHTLQVNGSIAKFTNSDFSVENKNALSVFMRGRYRDLIYTARYESGPVYFYDFYYFNQTGYFNTRQHYGIGYNISKSSKFRLNSSLNLYSYNSRSKPTVSILNNVYFHLPKAGLEVNISSNNDLLNLRSTPFISLSVQKNINIPLPFYKKYKSTKISLFKDINNNGIKDANEEPVKDATLQINNIYMATGENGEVFLKNIDKGNYTINYSKISNQKGWKPKDNLTDTLQINGDKEFEIPFVKSKSISGKVIFMEAKNSLNEKLNLAGVIITAKNPKGKEFKTITNEDGEFYLNIEDNIYDISVPFNAFGTGYHFDKNTLKVNLFDNSYQEINFTLIEKARKINIRKLN